MLDTVVLVLLATTATFGVLTLLRWLGAHKAGTPFPTALVAAHVTGSVVTLSLWTAHLTTDEPVWAWLALVSVLSTNGLGDLVLTGHWRRTAAMRGTLLKDFFAAVKDLKNPKRRTSGAHLVLAGTTTVLLALATLIPG